MADVDEKVMAFVEEELEKNPDATLDHLIEGAKKVSPSMNELTRRQFNARYPLQVKRRRAQARAPRRGTKRKPARPAARKKTRTASALTGQRDEVRNVFLQFATELSGAEERKDLVKVLAKVDQFVDRAIQAVGKG